MRVRILPEAPKTFVNKFDYLYRLAGRNYPKFENAPGRMLQGLDYNLYIILLYLILLMNQQ